MAQVFELYSIKDAKAGLFAPPIAVPNRISVIRSLLQELRTNKESMYSLYPGEFELWSLGTFDDKKGTIFSEPVLVSTLKTMVETAGAEPKVHVGGA